MIEEKKETGANIGLDEMLKGVGNLIDVVTKLKKESESGAINLEDIKNLNEKTKGLFGVSVKIGAGGISTVKEVISKLPGEPDKRVREPVVDVFEEKDYIEVIAELPGLEEKDIKYEIKNNSLTIYSVSDNRKYSKEMHLSSLVSANDVQSVYKNGILTLRLKKLA